MPKNKFQATDALGSSPRISWNAVIEDIKKTLQSSIKKLAIKEAKEEIGKENLLKAIAGWGFGDYDAVD